MAHGNRNIIDPWGSGYLSITYQSCWRAKAMHYYYDSLGFQFQRDPIFQIYEVIVTLRYNTSCNLSSWAFDFLEFLFCPRNIYIAIVKSFVRNSAIQLSN